MLPALSVASVKLYGPSPLPPLSVLTAVRRSVTWTALTIVLPGLTVASVKTSENVAVTDLAAVMVTRSEEHTSELQSLAYLVCRLLLEKKKTNLPNSSRRQLARSEEHTSEL